MAIAGFDTSSFINSVFEYAKAEFTEWATDKTVNDVEEIVQNLYPDADGLDAAAEAFYTDYGVAWGLSPNDYFNAAEYRLAWAAKQVEANHAFSTTQALTAYDAALAGEDFNGDAYAHYLAQGAAMNVNPSNDFDSSDYLDSLIAGLGIEDMTAEDLLAAAIEAGITPLDFFVDYPEFQDEYPAVAVQGDELVDAGGQTPVVSSFTLTNGTDVATANIFTAGQVYTPGGDDRINSLQDEDILTGNGTNPTLNAELGNANDNGARVITPGLNGIETVNAAFSGSDGAFAVTTLDLQDETGLAKLNITRISQAVNNAEVGNIMTVLTDMSVANTNANQLGIAEISFAAGVLAGENTANLTVSNVNLNNVNIGMNTSGVAAGGAFGVGVQGYEHLTLTSSGAANTIGALNLPMDTGTAGNVTIVGDKNITLAQTINVTNAATGAIESQNHAGGILQANGRLASIDASALTGNLTLNIAPGIFTTNKSGTSGVVQNVSITGGKGDDTFYLGDVIQAGDSLTGGDGTDTLVIVNGGSVTTTSSVVGSIEALKVEIGATAIAAQTATVDFDKLASVTGVTLRNVTNNNAAFPGPATPTVVGLADTFTLNNLTAAQAAAISIVHADSLNGGISQNVINANLKVATGASDTVAVTIVEGVNNDPRFNFLLNAPSVENITIVDADSESNTVALGNFTAHTGTITIGTTAGTGVAGSFLNLDENTVAAATNGGLYQYSTTGLAVGGLADAAGTPATNGQIIDQSVTANQVKLSAATINASAELGNVIVRVSSNAASAVGAQSITMGAGNDTVIFDNVNDNRAGLTISDTVAGGAGTGDVLVIDGNLAVAGTIALGASEWTNVSGFETIRLVNPGAGSTYALTLTDALINANNNGGTLAIVNDHDPINDTGRTVAAAALFDATALAAGQAVRNDAYNGANQIEASVVLDARSISASAKFSYNGEEGTSRTADRLIFSDVNMNGNAVVDGGAIDNITDNMGMPATVPANFPGDGVNRHIGNTDVIEIRNTAVVSQGDLANIKNIGTLSFTNDLAITQVSTLQLNDTIVDNMVDSYQASVSRAAVAAATTGGANVEALQINAVDNVNVAAATVGLTIEAGTLTDKSDLSITLGRGLNTVATGAGQDRVVLLGNYVAGTYAVVENGVNINAQSTANAVARVVTDNINLGTGTDTLVTYGALNVAGATLAGIETITANSALVMTASQFNALASLRFEGNAAHQLSIIDDIAGANTINLDKIVLAAGTLAYDITTNSNATGGSVNNMTAVGGTSVRDGAGVASATASVGVVTITPINGGGNATTATTITGAGNFTGTAGINDNFQSTIANLALATTITGTAADTETLTILDTGAVVIPATVTNIDNLVLNLGNTVTFAATTSGITRVTGSGAVDNVDLTALVANGAAVNVDLGAGAGQVLTLGGMAYTGTLVAGAGTTDTLSLVNNSNISSAGVTGFENLTIAANGAATMTLAQYSAFTGITATGSETVTLTTAGAIAGSTAIEKYVLANGTNNLTLASATPAAVTGGTGEDTVNASYAILQATTGAINFGTGSADTFNITTALDGPINLTALTGLGSVSNVDVVNVTGGSAATSTFTNANGAGILNFTRSATAINGITLGSGGQTLNLPGTGTGAATIIGGSGVDTINLSATVAANDNFGTGSVISAIDTISNFKAAGADTFGTGVAATSLNILNIATADSSTFASTIQTAATAAGASLAATAQAYVINVAGGTAAGTYAFQNTGSTLTTVDATDYIVRLTGTTGAIVAADFTAAGVVIPVDTLPPTVTAVTATIAPTGNASVTSNETGVAYLVRSTLAQPATLAALTALETANDTSVNHVTIATAGTATNLSALGLIDGTYNVYAVDAAGNLSTAAANTITVAAGGTPSSTVAVSGAGTSDASTGNITYTIASGTYTYTIDQFAAGDKLDVIAGAVVNVVPDASDTDLSQTITVSDGTTGATATIILTGITSAQDAGLFNAGSIDTFFGAGTVI